MTLPKFRAWDKISKNMFPVMMIDFGQSYVMIEEINGLWCERDFDEIELMQSTGLVDENGKEIFEGDIIKFECYGIDYVEEVVFDDKVGAFGTVDENGKVFSFEKLMNDCCADYTEVIGNIYESPELMEEME